MAAVARENLGIVRIPRKVILEEILKKIDGRKAEYFCWFEEGRYRCMVQTVMISTEENTSGKMEQVFGNYGNTQADAEEDAAFCMIEKLKSVYRFEVDDVNFIKRARNELRGEVLEEEIRVVKNVNNKTIEAMEKLQKGWSMVLNDMENAQEGVEDMCGGALATLRADYVSGPHTDLIGSVCSLNDWLECRILESKANMLDVIRKTVCATRICCHHPLVGTLSALPLLYYDDNFMAGVGFRGLLESRTRRMRLLSTYGMNNCNCIYLMEAFYRSWPLVSFIAKIVTVMKIIQVIGFSVVHISIDMRYTIDLHGNAYIIVTHMYYEKCKNCKI